VHFTESVRGHVPLHLIRMGPRGRPLGRPLGKLLNGHLELVCVCAMDHLLDGTLSAVARVAP
jgi:hypothetical protein